ncbi:FkbM family methyltransferase [Chitinophagaceae bacterium MMS25-I14]
MRIYPDYNYNLPRIIKYVNSKRPGVTVIDIGANIGDTVAFIKNYTDVPILCIDGEEKYIKILKSNVAQYSNVSVSHALVGAENKTINAKMKTERGTAFVEKSEKSIQMRTLENILQEFPAFQNSKILKTDTDGFDTIILRACTDFLKKVNPVLFLEFDPYLITKNGDDPFDFIRYLRDCGYYYFIFYMNNGDFLLSCTIEQEEIIDQLIHYFSGRNIAIFTDMCVFHKNDKDLFDMSVKEELEHSRKIRNY